MNTSTCLSKADVKSWLIESIGKTLFVSYDDIDCDAHLTELGMDSHEVMGLIAQLEDWLGFTLDTSLTENPGSINSLIDCVSSDLKLEAV